MHCGYTIFQSTFYPHEKVKYSWNVVDKKKIILTEPANFSASDELGRNFPTVQNDLEQRKNLYLIKLVSVMKNSNYKRAYCFFIFGIWLGLINSALRSASGTLGHFFQKSRHGTKNNSQISKSS